MKTPSSLNKTTLKPNQINNKVESMVFDLEKTNHPNAHNLEGEVLENYKGEPKKIRLSHVTPLFPKD